MVLGIIDEPLPVKKAYQDGEFGGLTASEEHVPPLQKHADPPPPFVYWAMHVEHDKKALQRLVVE